MKGTMLSAAAVAAAHVAGAAMYPHEARFAIALTLVAVTYRIFGERIASRAIRMSAGTALGIVIGIGSFAAMGATGLLVAGALAGGAGAGAIAWNEWSARDDTGGSGTKDGGSAR